MGFLRVATAFLALFCAFAIPAHAQTVWDTPGGSNCNSGFTLSGGNLIVTSNAAGWHSCRATTSHSTGKWYFRLTATTGGSNTHWMGGLENASGALTSYPGSDSNGLSCQGDTTNPIWFGTGGDAGCGTQLNDAAVWEVAVDLDAKKIWARVPAASSQWNKSGTADPATGTNGATYSITGALFISFGAFSSNRAATLDTIGGTPPSGFTVWDGSAAKVFFVSPAGPIAGH